MNCILRLLPARLTRRGVDGRNAGEYVVLFLDNRIRV